MNLSKIAYLSEYSLRNDIGPTFVSDVRKVRNYRWKFVSFYRTFSVCQGTFKDETTCWL